jgi:MFS family permease
MLQQFVPIVAFLLIGTGVAPVIGAVCLGLAIGLEVDVASYLTSRYFGLRNFGQIYGVVFAIFVLGTSVGGLLFAASFDYLGGYHTAFWICGVALLITGPFFLRLGPYPYPSVRKPPQPVRSVPQASLAQSGGE